MQRTNYFLVVTLLVSGIVLLSNLGIVTIGFGVIWPLFALLYGVYLFFQFQQKHQSDVLSPAVCFTLAGVFFFTTNFFAWPEGIPWWPVFPMFWGFGNLLTWLTGGRRENGMLLQSFVLTSASLLIMLGSMSWADPYLKFWPILLIFVGVFLLFWNRKHVNSHTQGS